MSCGVFLHFYPFILSSHYCVLQSPEELTLSLHIAEQHTVLLMPSAI